MDSMTLADEVIVCLPTLNVMAHKHLYQRRLRIKHQDMTLKFEYCNESVTEIKNTTLAVVANKPMKCDPKVPIVFYQMPYFHQQLQDNFPNSINLSPPWRPLKYAFMSFLKTMQWHRVFIISDDSEYSENFAKELISMFNKEGFAYKAVKCEGRDCQFYKVWDT